MSPLCKTEKQNIPTDFFTAGLDYKLFFTINFFFQFIVISHCNQVGEIFQISLNRNSQFEKENRSVFNFPVLY